MYKFILFSIWNQFHSLFWIRGMLACLQLHSFSHVCVNVTVLLLSGRIIFYISRHVQEIEICGIVSAFKIISILSDLTNPIDQLWFDQSLLSPTTCRGFDRMIVICIRSLCFFILNCMGRLNLLYPRTHTHTLSLRSGRNRISQPHPRTHTHTHTSMWWCSRQTWWRLILAKPPLSSVECQLSRESTQGPVAQFRGVGSSTTHPPRTHRNTHTSHCLPAAATDRS